MLKLERRTKMNSGNSKKYFEWYNSYIDIDITVTLMTVLYRSFKLAILPLYIPYQICRWSTHAVSLLPFLHVQVYAFTQLQCYPLRTAAINNRGGPTCACQLLLTPCLSKFNVLINNTSSLESLMILSSVFDVFLPVFLIAPYLCVYFVSDS
jgi:hypothetical protein